MSNKLPADVQARICKDALNAASGIGDQYRKDGVYHGYIAGATADRTNSQQLIDRLGIALENVYNIHSDQWTEYDRKEIKGILQQWKGKEVKDENSH